MPEDIGEHTRPLMDFDTKARKSEDFLKNKQLNPQLPANKPSLRNKIAAGLAVLGLGVAGVATVKTVEHQSVDNEFGKPVGSQLFEANLIHSTDNMGKEVLPVFRKKPSDTAHELTPEELKAMGINPLKPVEIQEVFGQTYSSDSSAGFRKDEKTGINHGIWGEIVVQDPNTGENKPTGIYLSENFISKTAPEVSPEAK